MERGLNGFQQAPSILAFRDIAARPNLLSYLYKRFGSVQRKNKNPSKRRRLFYLPSCAEAI